MEIQGQAAPGHSTGQAMLAMEALAKKLPAGIGYEWTGISLQQQLAGAQAPLFYALSILVVFLSLAALYESWTIPLSVIMVVPLGVLGALRLGVGSGAGSASQNAIGVGVIGGMLSATFLVTFLVPMFFVVISEKLRPQPKLAPEPAAS